MLNNMHVFGIKKFKYFISIQVWKSLHPSCDLHVRVSEAGPSALQSNVGVDLNAHVSKDIFRYTVRKLAIEN